MNRGGGEREGDTESEAVSRLCARAQCRARTHGLRDHDLNQSRMLNRLSHPGTAIYSNSMPPVSGRENSPEDIHK